MKQYLVNEETMNSILAVLNKAPYQDTMAVVEIINRNVKLVLPKAEVPSEQPVAASEEPKASEAAAEPVGEA